MEKCKSMSLHSFTASLAVIQHQQAFLGKGKKSAWEAWNSYPEVTQAFVHMSTHPHTRLSVESWIFQFLERCTVVLYDKTSSLETVNEAQRQLFCQKNRTMENIPPIQDAHLQHSKRVAYQAGIWTTCDMAQQQPLSPEGYGWTCDEERQSWVPVWISLPVCSIACSELVKCGCKSEKCCGARCSCRKVQWKCTKLCSCQCKK